MKDYVINIIYIAVFTVIVELVVPKHTFKKHIIGILSLLIVIAVVSPIFNILKSENIMYAVEKAVASLSTETRTSIENFDYGKYKNKTILSNVKEKLEGQLYKEFKAKINSVSRVKLLLDDSYKIEEIVVYVNGNNIGVQNIKSILNTLTLQYNVTDDVLVVKEERNIE